MRNLNTLDVISKFRISIPDSSIFGLISQKLVYAIVHEEAISVLQKFHEIGQRGQFLMKLPREYELVCSSLMSAEYLLL